MLKLYYSPGACSLAPHLLMHELKLRHESICVRTGDDAHRRPEFLAINPLGKVPALLTQDVNDEPVVLTEVCAIMRYLALLKPDAALWPRDPLGDATALEWLGLMAADVQPSFRMHVRADRVFPGQTPEMQSSAARSGREHFAELLDHLESRFVGPFALGADLSAVDLYLFVIVLWANFIGLDLSKFPTLRGSSRAMASRPAVRATLRAESLVDDSGRPTPPVRV